MKKFLVFLCALFVCVAHADTETINWYVDNSVYDTTTCQTGGDVAAPATQPTKYGYTFDGWEVALYDFSTLDYTIDGTDYIRDETEQEWAVIFPYGVLSGKSLCSVTVGRYAVTGDPDETTVNGEYCWCKATGYKPVKSNLVYESVYPFKWLFNLAYEHASTCASDCSLYCGLRIQRLSPNFRRAILGIQ